MEGVIAKDAPAGPGAGASVARTVAADAAATRTMQAIFVISIATGGRDERERLILCGGLGFSFFFAGLRRNGGWGGGDL